MAEFVDPTFNALASLFNQKTVFVVKANIEINLVPNNQFYFTFKNIKE